MITDFTINKPDNRHTTDTSSWLLTLPIALSVFLLPGCSSGSPLAVNTNHEQPNQLTSLYNSYDPNSPYADNRQSEVIDISTCPSFGSLWFGQVDGTEDRGFYYPEEAATYWVTILPSLRASSGHYEFRGEYVDARFFSFQTYTPQGLAIDAVFDEEVLPDSASSAPFLRGDQPNNSYTAELIPGEPPLRPSQHQDGIVYGGQVERDGSYLVLYRIYAPDPLAGNPIPPEFSNDPQQWETQGQRALPSLFYVPPEKGRPAFRFLEDFCQRLTELADTVNSAAGSIGLLTTQIGDALVPVVQQLEPEAGRLGTDPAQWFVGSTFFESLTPLFTNYPEIQAQVEQQAEDIELTEFFPNAANAYLATFINSQYGELNVTRFKAPTFPNTQAGEAIDPSIQDTRFWSVCIYNTFLLYVTDCLSDRDVEVDEAGTVTLVFSWPSARPVDPETGSAVKNWLSLSGPSSIVLYRHTLPSESFVQSHVYYNDLCAPFDRPCLSNYQALARWMGPYYPESAYCSKAEFEAGGC